jgi:hypothetical protein
MVSGTCDLRREIMVIHIVNAQKLTRFFAKLTRFGSGKGETGVILGPEGGLSLNIPL